MTERNMRIAGVYKNVAGGSIEKRFRGQRQQIPEQLGARKKEKKKSININL